MLQITKLFMFGLKKPHYRASTLFAICFVFNIASIVDCFGFKLDKYLLSGFIITSIFISMFYFINPNRHKNVLTSVSKNSLRSRVIGILATILYIFVSIILFIKMRLN